MQTSNPASPVLNQSIDEKLFRLLVANVKDYAIFMIDPNGYILSWNQGAANIKGYQQEEITGSHISVFYTAKDNEKNEPRHNLNMALKNGSYESEGWRLRKDGTMFWADVVFTTLYNDTGHLIGFAKIVRDITERKQKEDKKQQVNAELERRVAENTKKIITNEQKFRKLIENSYEGITLFNKDLRITYRSISSEVITGWSTTARKECETIDMLHPDDKEQFEQLFADILKNPTVPILSTFRIKHKKGHYIWVECYFANLLDNKSIAAVVCNFRDITEKKNHEIEREKITADLLRRNKDLEQFTYIISHNLRAPVANIKGLSDLLNCFDYTDPECVETLDALALSVKNMDKVIIDLNQILQTGRQVNDKNELVPLPVLVEEISAELHEMIQNNNASINCDFGEVDELYILKGFLYSIFQNLIVNSIKYRRDDADPIMLITTAKQNDKVIITFKDNGKGIDMEKNGTQVFGLYKRFDHTVEGKGMGLFMVKMQVESLGGTISVESELNAGTEFRIELLAGVRADA